MSLFKKYSVQEPNGNVLEEFSTHGAAETFQQMLLKQGKQALVVTKDDDAQDELKDDGPATYDIEGLDPVVPDNDFGSDLDDFNEEDNFFSSDEFEDPAS